MLIAPVVAARIRTYRVGVIVLIAAGIDGAAISAAVQGVPTGPVIVMLVFAAFLISALVAPKRGQIGRLRVPR